ncbi:MAG TPA: PilZ domain-containing protein [Pyrinomonadaceae bacterium]|nr:PilZ domain-containing protein [Pyrinomonadaceae bacterium]
MITLNSNNNGNGNSHERRRFPRYYVASRLTLAIEDESLKESIGLGEPQDISLGGLRVTNLPACPNVKVGDQLGLLLLDGEDALSLTAEVVHHATTDTFGVEFRGLSNHDQRAVGEFIGRLHAPHKRRASDSR